MGLLEWCSAHKKLIVSIVSTIVIIMIVAAIIILAVRWFKSKREGFTATNDGGAASTFINKWIDTVYNFYKAPASIAKPSRSTTTKASTLSESYMPPRVGIVTPNGGQSLLQPKKTYPLRHEDVKQRE